MRFPSRFAVSLILIFCSHSAVMAQDVTSVTVPGHVPIQPGEHPRLLFRKSELPEIRRRAQTPEGRRIVERLRATLGGGEALPEARHPSRIPYADPVSLPEGAWSISHAAGYGMLYQLTGDKKYADLGRKAMEIGLEGQRDRDFNARYATTDVGEPLRLGPSMAWTALGYDLCYDGWDPAFRERVAQHIQNYNRPAPDGRKMSDFLKTGKWTETLTMEKQAMDPPYHPGSNHFGAITGGNGMALLGIYGDPGTDTAKLDKYLERLEANAAKALGGFGPRGFFFEGQGPSHMAAYPGFISFWQALKNVKGRDYITPNERLHWITLRWIGETVPAANGRPNSPVRHEAMGMQYGSEDLTPTGGISESGRFSLGFGALPAKYHPALLWVYQNFFSKADQQRLDTINYPHLAIAALVNWPIGATPRNPAEVGLPLAYRDTQFGHYVFRNQWKDDKDILITVFSATQGGTRSKPWKSLPVKVWAMGRRVEFDLGWKEKGPAESYWQELAPGTTVAGFDKGMHVGVDFSGRAGVPGVLVTTGGSMGSGYSGELLHRKLGPFQVMTMSPNNLHPEAKVEGETVTVGGLKIAMVDGKLNFSNAEQAVPGTVDAYVVKKIDPSLDAVSPETVRHPGKPDALLSFDVEDSIVEGRMLAFRDAMAPERRVEAYNMRPDLLTKGVWGEAFPFRPKWKQGTPTLGDQAVDPETAEQPAEAEKKADAKPESKPDTDADSETKSGTDPGEWIITALEIPVGSPLILDSQSATLSYWFKLNEPREGYAIFMEPRGGGNYHLGFHPGPTLQAAGNSGTINVSYPNEPDIWRHIAYVFDAERKILSVYIDGAMAGRVNASPSAKVTTPLYVGARGGASSTFPTAYMIEGDIDELAIYKRALTAGEILALAESTGDPEKSLAGARKANRPPALVLRADRSAGPAPLEVVFDALRSVDPEGDALTFAWDFGDGNKGTGPNPRHTFLKNGSYTVTCTATDPSGNSHQATWKIQAANRKPSAFISVLEDSGARLVLSSEKSMDPDGTPLRTRWQSPTGATEGPQLSLENLPPGSHEITCTVTDPEGASAVAYYTVSIPDSQGFRLPENPANLLPGLHYQHFSVFKDDGGIPKGERSPDFRDVQWKNQFKFLRAGVLDDLSISTLRAGNGGANSLAGYLRIPADGTYTLTVDGFRSAWVILGDKGVARYQSKFANMEPETVSLQLRAGLHRIRIQQAGYQISKTTPQGWFFLRMILSDDKGNSRVLGPGDFLRSPTPGEATALNLKAIPGPDLLSLGDPGTANPPLADGNKPPKITLTREVLSQALGSQTLRFLASVEDPDGDAVTLTWTSGDGQVKETPVVDGKADIARVFGSGDRVLTVSARDGRGGESTLVEKIQTPAAEGLGRSISFSFPTLGGRGARGGLMPGEEAGVVPSSNWNPLVSSENGFQTAFLSNSKPMALRDQLGNEVAVTLSSPDRLGGRAIIDIPLHNAHDRLMASGLLMNDKNTLQIEGIPYARYDVLLYTAGDGFQPAPDARIWEPLEVKRDKNARPLPGPAFAMVNDQRIELPDPGKQHRWGGIYRLMTPTEPAGNVLHIPNQSGPSLRIQLSGALLNGMQIVEKK